MMIVPVDADDNKTQNIAQEYRQDRFQSSKVSALRYSQIKYHNGDDDGKDTVAKRLKPVLLHKP